MDYTSTPITATFTAGTTSTTIDVPVTMDDIAEGSETFTIKFTIPPSLSSLLVPGEIPTTVATIIDFSGMHVIMSKLSGQLLALQDYSL